jgi:hypothetical protein
VVALDCLGVCQVRPPHVAGQAVQLIPRVNSDASACLDLHSSEGTRGFRHLLAGLTVGTSMRAKNLRGKAGHQSAIRAAG